MASSAFTVCLARDGGRIGCKLLRDNTVSTVHPDTPAARASLRRGDRVIQVNGRAVHSDNGAFEALKKQTGAQIELSIVRDESHSELSTNQSLKRQRSPRQSAGTTKKEPSKSVQYVSGCDKSLPSSKERNKQRCSSKDHITPSPRSLSPIRVASARSGCTQVAGRTSASSASSSLEARVSSNARRRLEHLLESRAVDVKADVLSRLKAGNPAALTLLMQMYPPTCKVRACIFCDECYVEGAQGTCSVQCDMEWDDEYVPTARKGLGLISGRCRRCGNAADDVMCTEDGAINYPPRVCYEGPHRSEQCQLALLRIRTLGDSGDQHQPAANEAELSGAHF